MEKAPIRTSSWLKVPTNAFTFKTLVGTFSEIVKTSPINRLQLYIMSCTSNPAHPHLLGKVTEAHMFGVHRGRLKTTD